ncbi:MAG: hypothetical protein RLY93_12310 [Sumerlaeia bacterium]
MKNPSPESGPMRWYKTQGKPTPEPCYMTVTQIHERYGIPKGLLNLRLARGHYPGAVCVLHPNIRIGFVWWIPSRYFTESPDPNAPAERKSGWFQPKAYRRHPKGKAYLRENYVTVREAAKMTGLSVNVIADRIYTGMYPDCIMIDRKTHGACRRRYIPKKHFEGKS